MVPSVSSAGIAGMSPGRRRRVAELEARIAALGQPIVFASNQARRSTRPASIGLTHRVTRLEKHVAALKVDREELQSQIEEQWTLIEQLTAVLRLEIKTRQTQAQYYDSHEHEMKHTVPGEPVTRAPTGKMGKIPEWVIEGSKIDQKFVDLCPEIDLSISKGEEEGLW